MDYRIEKIVNHVNDDISRAYSISAIALSLNMSVSRFQHLFKQEMKMSFTQYVRTARLRKACALLQTTHMLVKEITFKIGCRDETNFIRSFKQEYNETPANYRRKSYEIKDFISKV